MNIFTRAIMALLVMVLVAGIFVSFFAIRFLSSAPSVSDESVVFEVKPGESFKTVAKHLEEQQLVRSAWKLEIYVRITRLAPKIRIGEYALRRNFRPREILSVLTSGKSIEYSVTVPEGTNRFEIADIAERSKVIDRAEFLKLTTDSDLIEELLGQKIDSFEGYLFPETYHLTKYTGAEGFIRMMVSRFKDTYSRVQALPGWKKGELTDRQIVTLASIIEKETMAPEERAVISSVFYNRMKIRMPLQTDPTIIYGIYLDTGSWNGTITRGDLTRRHPYNSYLNQGLPPGPISNPGFEALKAAGSPADTDYLFFVSRNNGTHTFSSEYSQHQKAVTDYKEDRKTDGKSWRDLKKRESIPDRVVEAPGKKKPKIKKTEK